jgi:hypothetical protein
MPEIGTSGSMSEDGKRGVAKWPKLPRPSSTLPSEKWADVPVKSAMRVITDIPPYQQRRQFGDVAGDAPRLVARQQSCGGDFREGTMAASQLA